MNDDFLDDYADEENAARLVKAYLTFTAGSRNTFVR